MGCDDYSSEVRYVSGWLVDVENSFALHGSCDSGFLGPEESRSGWQIGLLSTFLPMAGTASLLVARWQRIPSRIPIHWDLYGGPNGWAERSVGSIFGLLFASFLMVLVFGFIGELIVRSSPGHDGRTALIRAIRSVLLACAWMITILFCA